MNDPFATTVNRDPFSGDPWPPEPTERKVTEAELFASAKEKLLAALDRGPVVLTKAWSVAGTSQPMVDSVIAHLRQSGVIEDHEQEWGPLQIRLFTGTVNDTEPSAIRWPRDEPFIPDKFDPFAQYVDAETGEPLIPHKQ